MNKIHMMRDLIKKFLILFCIIYVHNINAISLYNNVAATNATEVKIDSDQLIIEKSLNLATFKGNVTVYFQDMKLKTNILRVTYRNIDNKDKIDKIHIPTKLTAIKNCGAETVIADSGTYDAEKKNLTLIGNVILQKNKNILSTNRLVYHVEF